MREFKTRWQRRPYSVLEARTPPSTRTDRISREYPDRTLPRLDCVSCPFRSGKEWVYLRDTDAMGFEFAVQLDERLRTLNRDKTLEGAPYLHKTLRPLAEAVESYNSAGPLFEDSDEPGEECEGVCFVQRCKRCAIHTT